MRVRLVIAAVLATAVAFVVAGHDRSSGRTVPSCTKADALDIACWRDRYHALTVARGPRAALQDLGRERRRSGYVRAACHQLTHEIGRTQGERDGIAAIDAGGPQCAVGFPHGVVEAVVSDVGADHILGAADDICAGLRERGSEDSDHYNCIHGLGHGFMFVFGSDVFRSLRGCDRVGTAWERDRCAGGVFMENLTAIDNASRPSSALKPHRPLYPCTAIARRYKAQCYQWQTAYVLYLNGTDFGAAFRVCGRAEPAFRRACYGGLGRDAAAFRNKAFRGTRVKNTVLRHLCGLGRSRAARTACIAGAVDTMVTDVPARGVRLAERYCDTYERPRIGPMHAACLRALNHSIREAPLQSGPPAHPPTFTCPLLSQRERTTT